MKCPCCHAEMLLGFIYNGNQPVQWIPGDKKPSILSFTVAEDGVTLKNKFEPIKTGGYKAEAHYCEKCKLVIAPTK